MGISYERGAPVVGGRRRVSSVSSEYRGTSLARKRTPLGPYSRTMPRLLWWCCGGGRFLMSEVPLFAPPPFLSPNHDSSSPRLDISRPGLDFSRPLLDIARPHWKGLSNTRFRAKRDKLERCGGLLLESQGQNLALTILCAPSLLDSASLHPQPPKQTLLIAIIILLVLLLAFPLALHLAPPPP